MARRQRDLRLEQIWRQHLQRQRTSDQTVRAYCRQHDLAETAFHYWRRTIAAREREVQRTTRTPAFVPVAVVGAPALDAASIDIRLSGGQRIRVRAGCDRALLAAVVAVLEGRPC